MMATDQNPETINRIARTRERMAKVKNSQQTTMLTALVLSLVVAGITALALLGTWVAKHSHEFGNKPSYGVEAEPTE
ncbi:MAG: hypothetical protein ACFCU1_05645 [Sumerlaeia bacterium]